MAMFSKNFGGDMVLLAPPGYVCGADV